MGTVLAVTRSLGAAAALALLLAGCATSADEGAGAASGRGGEARALAILGRLQSLVEGTGGGGETGRGSRGDFSAEAIAADPGGYRIVQIASLGVVEPARVIQDNGAGITIELQSGPTAAYRDGVLVATRGFSDDLNAFDSRGVLAVLRAGGGTVERRMELLDGQDQIRTLTFACTITPAGTETVDLGVRRADLRRFDENCRSSALIFDNIYWLDGSGGIAASRQYVSPGVAYLRSNRL